MNPERAHSPAASRCAGAALFAVTAALAGCATTVSENHYFAAFADKPGGGREAVQFYRLAVDGDSQFANTRYLTGYFDERAVSLFFNELKSPSNQKLFDEGMTLPGSGGSKITPLSPTAENGAFVLIMSTNADAIANTIGSFAESQVVADSLTRLLNRDRFIAKTQSDAKLSINKAEATSLVAQLTAHTQAATAAVSSELAAASYRRALTALAQSIGYTGPEFTTMAKARDWFTLEASTTAASTGAQQ
ncbi:MAG: hypothetical protein ACK4PH_01750 [Aquincola tertiaricarbonis]